MAILLNRSQLPLWNLPLDCFCHITLCHLSPNSSCCCQSWCFGHYALWIFMQLLLCLTICGLGSFPKTTTIFCLCGFFSLSFHLFHLSKVSSPNSLPFFTYICVHLFSHISVFSMHTNTSFPFTQFQACTTIFSSIYISHPSWHMSQWEFVLMMDITYQFIWQHIVSQSVGAPWIIYCCKNIVLWVLGIASYSNTLLIDPHLIACNTLYFLA